MKGLFLLTCGICLFVTRSGGLPSPRPQFGGLLAGLGLIRRPVPGFAPVRPHPYPGAGGDLYAAAGHDDHDHEEPHHEEEDFHDEDYDEGHDREGHGGHGPAPQQRERSHGHGGGGGGGGGQRTHRGGYDAAGQDLGYGEGYGYGGHDEYCEHCSHCNGCGHEPPRRDVY